MTNRSHDTKDARKIEKLYNTKGHGTSHSTVLRLIRERGLDGAISQLESWGMTQCLISEISEYSLEIKYDSSASTSGISGGWMVDAIRKILSDRRSSVESQRVGT